MLASIFMSAMPAINYSNPKQGIAVCFARTVLLSARRFSRGLIVAHYENADATIRMQF